MNEAALALMRQLTIRDVLDFFASMGWNAAPHPNERIYFMQPSIEELPDVEFILPRNREAVDFERRLTEALDSVGEVFNEQPDDLIRRIRYFSTDVVKTRFMADDADQHTLRWDVAHSLVGQVKNLLTFAAAGEREPLPYFSGPSKFAKEQASAFRFGHTFDGSFGFTIESPLPVELQPRIWSESNVPFQRRVVERIHRGMEHVAEAVKQESIGPLANGYVDGFNANMCDALVAMRKTVPDLLVEYSVSWSPRITRTQSDLEQSTIAINPTAFEYLKAAATELRTVEPPKAVSVFGRVVLLQSDSQPWESVPTKPHSIVIAWNDGKRLIRTRVDLEADEYLKACDAHKSGSNVAMQGTLERRSSGSILREPYNFNWKIQDILFDGLNEVTPES